MISWLTTLFECSWKELMTAYWSWGGRRLRSQIWWVLFPWTWLPFVNFWRKWLRKLTLMGLMDQDCWVLELNILTSRVGKSYRYDTLQSITTRIYLNFLQWINTGTVSHLQLIKLAIVGREMPLSQISAFKRSDYACFLLSDEMGWHHDYDRNQVEQVQRGIRVEHSKLESLEILNSEHNLEAIPQLFDKQA